MLFRIFCLSLLTAAAVAQEHGEADHHVVLRPAADLSLRDTVDSALVWQGERSVYAADRALAKSESTYARGLISESPALGMSYQSDKPLDRAGLRQSEVFVKLPLWAPGERGREKAWAQARSAAVDTAQAERRWRTAGEVRDTLWQIKLKQQALATQQRHEQVLQRISGQLQRRFAAGDAARYDTLLAEQELLNAREAIHSAEAELVDAGRQYFVRTGLEDIPAEFREALSERSEIDVSHPALAEANAQVEIARRAHETALKQRDAHPSLSFNVKREQGFSNEPIVDSVGATIEWPLGVGGRSPVRAASANLALTNAQLAQQRALRELQGALHEAHHRLEVLEKQIVDAERASKLGDEQLRMQMLAFDAGEISLQDLLLTERRQFTAASHLEQLRIERDYAIAQYNQAVGVLP